MKKNMFTILALLAALGFATLPLLDARAEESSEQADYVQNGIDFFDSANDKISDVTDDVYDALVKSSKDEKTLQMLTNALNKVGVKGGWAKQLGELNKVKGFTKAFSLALKAISTAKTVGELSAAFNAGDKELFRKIVADQLTDAASGLVGVAAGTLVHAAGAAIIGAAALTGPGFIIASGVVLVADWYISDKVETTVSDAIKDGTMYNAFQDVGDIIWNLIENKDSKKDLSDDSSSGEGNGDIFDGDPGSSGGQYCPAPQKYKGLNKLNLSR